MKNFTMLRTDTHKNTFYSSLETCLYQSCLSSGFKKLNLFLQVQKWLRNHNFESFVATFQNYDGKDMLRLSLKEFVALCGIIEGRRLFDEIRPVRNIIVAAIF